MARIEGDEIRTIARSDSAEETSEAEKACRLRRGRAQGLRQRHAEEFNAVAHGRRHVEMSAGERTVRPRAAAVPNADFLVVERERGTAPPTVGIASVTSIGRATPRSARRSMAGSTW